MSIDLTDIIDNITDINTSLDTSQKVTKLVLTEVIDLLADLHYLNINN